MCIMKRRIKISMILNFCKFVCRVIFFPYLQTEPKISLSRIVLGRIQFGISVWFWELFDKSLKFNFSGFGPRFGIFLAEQVQRSGFLLWLKVYLCWMNLNKLIFSTSQVQSSLKFVIYLGSILHEFLCLGYVWVWRLTACFEYIWT